jgi:tryptophan synthase alpha chain
VPVCVGFGISSSEQAREVSAYADGVVIGSAIVKRIEDAASPADAVEDVRDYIGELKQALRGHA